MSSPLYSSVRLQQSLPYFAVHSAMRERHSNTVVDALLSIIEKKTAAGRLPRRADIHPVELKTYLPNLCFLEPVFAGNGVMEDVVVRLMGTEVVSFYGELTGQSIFAHPAPEVAGRIFKCLEASLEAGEPLYSAANALSGQQDHLSVGVLYVPMSENGYDIDRFLLHVQVQRKSSSHGKVN